MAQRAFTKKNDPGVWGPAVAGTIEEGEEYDDNIVKETQEEIGLSISIADLQRGPKIRISGHHNDYFTQWYLYTIDKSAEDFKIPHDEVAQVKWFSREKLVEAIHKHPEEFVPSAPQWSKVFLS